MSYGTREAFRIVPETCPVVDSALERAADAIKEQTGKLRDALIDALDRAIEAEEMVEDLESKIEDLKETIAELQNELKELGE